MAKNAISADEKRWRAEDDARALRRAQEIQNDPSRVKEAHKIIQKELNALSSVASTINSTKKTTTKKTVSKSTRKGK